MEQYIEKRIHADYIWVRDTLANLSSEIDRWRNMYELRDAEFENYKNNVERVQAEKCKRCKECKALL